VGGDPSNSKQCLIVAIVNLDAISDFHFASAAAEPHSPMADIESVNEMTVLAPNDPDADWHDRFGSLPLSTAVCLWKFEARFMVTLSICQRYAASLMIVQRTARE
jgi:hypothetical protein